MQTTAHDTLLSKTVTVSQYRQFEANQDRLAIANLIQERLTERYITPLRGRNKHGFCTMAICCLMLESMVAFQNGWKETPYKKGTSAFKQFFELFPAFAIFQNYADLFYKHVRCGILHQGETSGGWRIRRNGPLFDEPTKTINATRFHNLREESLHLYCDQLRQAEWDVEDGSLWKNCTDKMKAICKNCGEQG